MLRDGREQVIDASLLVPGDILKLEAGDFVPADARLLRSTSLKSEESALTGESVPAEKDADATVDEKAPLGDRVNMVYSGCSITYGTATAVVTATGMQTEMGRIAGLLEGEDEGADAAGRSWRSSASIWASWRCSPAPSFSSWDCFRASICWKSL